MPNYYPPPISGGGGGGTVTLPIAESDVTSLVSDLALKAPLASPTFTGTPALPTGTTATTQSASDGTTKLATTAYTDTAGALKANLASPTFTGTPSLPTGTTATTQSAADSTTKLATTAFTTTADNLKANLASPTFTGTVVLPDSTVTSAMITDGAIVNADVNASAAIAYSKLALTGAVLNADLAGSIAASKITGTAVTAADTGTVTSAMIVDGTIVNADVNASAAITGEKLAMQSFQPADHGLKFWSFDHTVKTANQVLTSGTLTLIKIKTPTVQTITTVSLGCTVLGSSLTSGQNLIAVCDSTGAQLGSTSADQTTPWASTGLKTATVGSFSTTAGSFVYVILLSVGGTPPSFGSCNAGVAAITNIGLSASAYRAATNLTTQTTMGGLPLTLANNASVGFHLWAGLS